MKTVPLALLAFRGGCPVTEAYLMYMRSQGLRPALILAVDYVGAGGKAALLQSLLGTRLAARLMRVWRNRRARVDEQTCAALQQAMPVKLHPGREPDFNALAERVVHLTVRDYADPKLLAAMRDCGLRSFLYCSGGRVPATLFEQGFKIIHIHPGIVPHVRGSDGLLWSLLMRGKPGASCFFMNAGIDTGQLIATAEFEAPSWPGLKCDPETLYAAIIQCFDPHLRASLLLSVLGSLKEGEAPENLAAARQTEDGEHYFAMHPQLRARLLARYCQPGSTT